RVQRTSEKEKRKKKRKKKRRGDSRASTHRHQSPASPPPSPRPTRETEALAAQRRPAIHTSCSSRRVAAPSCRVGGLCRLFVAARERRPPSSDIGV
ncbi:hypothetical protein ACHAXT_005871, partial [Thalassiosira profunda]